jgi:hypothetical protein
MFYISLKMILNVLVLSSILMNYDLPDETEKECHLICNLIRRIYPLSFLDQMYNSYKLSSS